MAIAFAQMAIHSRRNGHSAVAGAAYRAGEVLVDKRTAEIHDYGKKSNVAYSEIILPKGAGERFQDRETLWNAVELAEKRKDAQVAKDLVLALPNELTFEQQKTLARQFANKNFVDHGLAVDMSFHLEEGNPHAHLYISTRRIIGADLDRYKARDLNPSFANWKNGHGFIAEDQYWGKKWGNDQQHFFDEHELGITVDPYYLISQVHEGRFRGDEKHHLAEENEIRRRESVRLCVSSPEVVLDALEEQYGIFTEKHIDLIIEKNTDQIEQVVKAKEAVIDHKDLILLGPADDGRDRYTTKSHFLLEARMAMQAKSLSVQKHQKFKLAEINRMIATYGLNEGQASVLYDLGKGSGLSIIVGRAGTGKSFLMRPACELWKKQGYHIQGMAFSSVAAEGLMVGSGIKSHTIAHYKKLLKNGAWHLDKNDVVVMDEAGMTNLSDMAFVIQHVHQSGARLVLTGDHAQLQPVGTGAPFRALLEAIGFAEMDQVVRQELEGDRYATELLSRGQVGEALDYYAGRSSDQPQESCVHLLEKEDLAFQALLTQWEQSLSHTSLPKQLILAFENKDVVTLNERARECLVKRGALSQKGTHFKTTRGDIEVSLGERLLFLKNNKKMGVSNGSYSTVVGIKRDYITVQMDGREGEITFSTKEYQHYTYAYAATVHKSQGATLDRVFVYASGYWNRFLTYVALSRHRKCVSLYASKENYVDFNELKKELGNESLKDSILDWPVSFSLRRGFDSDSIIGRAIDSISKLKAKITKPWRFLCNYEKFLHNSKNQQSYATKAALREKAKRVAEYIDLHRAQGKSWSEINNAIKQNLISREALNHETHYHNLVAESHYKNSLAATILADQPTYERALMLNRVKIEGLQESARRYVIDQRAYDFVDALKLGQLPKMHSLAPTIKAHQKEHYRALAYRAQSQNIPIEQVIQTIHNCWVKHLSEDKAVVQKIDRHFEYSRQIGRYLQKAQACERAAESARFEQKNDVSVNRYITLAKGYQKISRRLLEDRDSISNQLHINSETCQRYQPYYRFLNINKIKQQTKTHRRRMIVREYTQTSDPDKALRYAFMINKDKNRFKPVTRSEGLIWPDVWRDSQLYERKLIKARLSPDGLVRFELIEKFEALYKASIESYLAVKDFEKSHPQPLDTLATELLSQLRANMYESYAKRHKCAYEIDQDGRDLLKHFKRIDTKRFDRYVKLHEERLLSQQRVSQYCQSPTDQLADEICKRFNKHIFFLKAAKVDLNQLNVRAAMHQHSIAASGYSGFQRKAYKAFAEYDITRYQNGIAWQSFRANKKSQHEQMETSLVAARDAMRIRNQAAYTAFLALTPENEEMLSSFRFDREQLAKHADAHALQLRLQGYQTLTEEDKPKSAYEISQHRDEKSLFIALREVDLNPREFLFNRDSFARQLYAKKLSEVAQGYYNVVTRYVTLTEKSRITWKQYFDGDKSKLQPAQQLNLERNRVASQIFNFPSIYSDFVVLEEIKISQLKKHTEQYQRSLDRASTFDYKSKVVDKSKRKVNEQRDSAVSVSNDKPAKVTHASRIRWDYQRINDILVQDPKATYEKIFREEGKNKGAGILRFSDAVTVTTRGVHAGSWFSFKSDMGGGPIQAICHYRDMNYSEALLYAAEIAGLTREQATIEEHFKPTPKSTQENLKRKQQEAAQIANRIACAQSIWDGTQPIAGTLAERYFRDHRGVTDIDRMEVRYWPVGQAWSNLDDSGKLKREVNSTPAAVIAARDASGQLTGVQRIYLDKNTGMKNSFFDNPKLSKGVTKGSAGVIYRGKPGNRLYIAEGPETAASLALIDKNSTVLCSFGVSNLSNISSIIQKYQPNEIILAADNDGEESKTRATTKEAFDSLKSKLSSLNVQILLKYPKQLPGLKKTDWNDVLLQKGEQELMKSMGVKQHNATGVTLSQPPTKNQQKPIDWLSKEYDGDFERLKVVKDIKIERLVDKRERLKTAKDKSQQLRYTDQLEYFAMDIVNSKIKRKKLCEVAPKFARAIIAFSRAREKNMGLDHDC